jgi:DNA-binding MarR family transcriptional regulator
MTTQVFDSTYWMLVQAAIRTKHDFARLAELYDLTVMQLITVCSLEPGRPIPMSQISCFLACDASNVTGIVDRLAGRGLIERTEGAQDRRIKMIALTAKGEHLRRNAIEEIDGTQPESMSALDTVEFKELHRLLKKALSSKPGM